MYNNDIQNGIEEDVYQFTITPSYQRFYSDDSNFGVYEFYTKTEAPKLERYSEMFAGKDSDSFVGVIAGQTGRLELGVEYNVEAKLEYNNKYRNWQYTPQKVIPIIPADEQKIRKFLNSIITTNQTDALLEVHPNIVDMVVSGQEVDLTNVKGVKEKTFSKIQEKIINTYGSLELTIFLSPFGISQAQITKLFGSDTNPEIVKKKIQDNPYYISDIKGFGFKKADEIALKLNPNFRKSMHRTVSYVKYLLSEVANKHGHTWIGSDKFLEECRNNIPECKEFIFEILRNPDNNKWLFIDRERKMIGLKGNYNLENRIANDLLRLRDAESDIEYDNADETIKKVEQLQGWEFTDEQISTIYDALNSNVICITGFGGTGKTSIANAITKVLKNYTVAQTALSGKASLVIKEATGIESYTIHRLLGYKGHKFKFNKDNKMNHDIYIIDEASMIGADLFSKLLEAIPNGAKVIIMGDISQLESIGVGSVFKDIMKSGVIKTSRLTKIHRQAQKSAIITESIKVKDQKHIVPKGFIGEKTLGELQDLHLDIYANKIETRGKIISYFEKCLKENNNYMETQVIVPMKERGYACTYMLNTRLQDIANPPSKNKPEVNLGVKTKMPYCIRLHDKVINMKNQYNVVDVYGEETPVFNGNVGMVVAINENDMVIDFIGIGEIIIPKKSWNEIELGYAGTAHKFQGSQFDKVIVGIDASSYVMHSKEWLYTAITRAKSECYLVSDIFSIRSCVSKSNLIHKLTHLDSLLIEKDYKKLDN